MGKQLHRCGFPSSACQLSCPAPVCVCSVGQRLASSSACRWGDGRSCWFRPTPPAQPVLLLLVEITTSSDLPAERLVWTPPNLLWSTWARLSLNGLSRRFLLTQFDWSGLRGTHTSISANTSWEGINSWEKAMTSGWDYQPLLLTQLNQESTRMRSHNFRDRHEFTLQTTKVTISHQLYVAALTTAQGEGEACYSLTLARSWQGSPARKVQASVLQHTRNCSCLPFRRLNWEGGNFHLICAETCSLELEVNLVTSTESPLAPDAVTLLQRTWEGIAISI